MLLIIFTPKMISFTFPLRVFRYCNTNILLLFKNTTKIQIILKFTNNIIQFHFHLSDSGPSYTIPDSWHTGMLCASDRGCSYTTPRQSGVTPLCFCGGKPLRSGGEVIWKLVCLHGTVSFHPGLVPYNYQSTLIRKRGNGTKHIGTGDLSCKLEANPIWSRNGIV